MIVLPELMMDALRREHDLALERDLQQRRAVALLQAVARCCRPSFLARMLGARPRPVDGPCATG